MSSKIQRIVSRVTRLALAAAVLVLLYDSWCAVLDDLGSNQLIVPLQTGEAGDAQLFYDLGAGWSEQDSVRVKLHPSEKMQELAFLLPRAPVSGLRFDPLPAAGKFRMEAPRLVTASGRVRMKFPFAAIKPRNDIGTFRQEGGEWVGTTVAGAQDPQLSLGLAEPLQLEQTRLPWIDAAAVGVLVVLASVFKDRRAAG